MGGINHGANQLKKVPFNAGEVQPIDLPKSRLMKELNLQFDADVVVAGGSASGTVVEDPVLKLIDKIEIIGNGSTVLYRWHTREMYYDWRLKTGIAGALTNPANGDAATTSLVANLTLPFRNEMSQYPQDGYLNELLYDTLELFVTWGTPNAMFTGAYDRAATIANSFGITPIVFETDRPVPTISRRRDFISKQVTATDPTFTIPLPLGARTYQGISLLCTDANARSDSIITDFNIVINEKYDAFRRIPWTQLQNDNRHKFGIAPVTGQAYLNLLEDGLLKRGLSVDKNIENIDIVANVTVGSGTTVIYAYLDYFI